MRILLLLFLIITITACSSLKQKIEKPKKLTKFIQDVVVRERWHRQVGKGLDSRYCLFKPVININTVFANDMYGRVYAYDREIGEEKWVTDLNLNICSGVGIGDTLILIGSLNGDVVALNQSTGKKVWVINISGAILAPPQISDEIVIVQTNEGKLYGLDANTGAFLWSYTAKLPQLTLRGTATPQLFGNNLIAGFSNGKIAAFSANDGVLFWETRIAYPSGKLGLNQLVDVDGTPVVSNNTIYATSYNGNLTAISPDAHVLWARKVSSYQSPLVIDSRVFVTTADSILCAYNAKTGESLWRNALLLNRKISAPQSVAGFVVVSDYQGYIHVFDPEIGAIIARSRLDRSGIRSPMISDGVYLYALSNGGKLSSMSLYLRSTYEE